MQELVAQGISVAIKPPWCLLGWVLCLNMYPGRVMVGGMGFFMKDSSIDMMGGVAVASCNG